MRSNLRIDELTQWLAGSVNNKFLVFLRFSWLVDVNQLVQSVDHARDNMADSFFEVVVRSEDITRNDRREAARILLVVGAVQHVDGSLCVTVAKVAVMRWSVVNLQRNL